MKIFNLADSPNGESYKLNSSKSRMFAHSGAGYWRIFLKFCDISKEDFDLFDFMYVGLPLMHMALELLVKAFVTFYDSSYNPKKDRHNTSIIINKYANKIETLKLINDSAEKMELIKTVELAWEGLRYAECGLDYKTKDTELFNEIMIILTDNYKKISKLPNL